MRVLAASQIVSTPMPIESASSPEAASAGVAPTAVRPVSTTANAPPQPTTAATTPATTRCPVRSCVGSGRAAAGARGSGRGPGRLQHGGQQSREARVEVLSAQRVSRAVPCWRWGITPASRRTLKWCVQVDLVTGRSKLPHEGGSAVAASAATMRSRTGSLSACSTAASSSSAAAGWAM